MAYQYQNACKVRDYQGEKEIFTHWPVKLHKNPLSKKCNSTLTFKSGSQIIIKLSSLKKTLMVWPITNAEQLGRSEDT